MVAIVGEERSDFSHDRLYIVFTVTTGGDPPKSPLVRGTKK